MSDITPPIPRDRQVIQGYGGGGFRISNQRLTGAVLVTPSLSWTWGISVFEDITLSSFNPLHDNIDKVEILLIGCGPTMRLLPPTLRAGLRDWGIGVETMDTGAACRTYNVLLSEDRRVAAALLPVD
jgi:uncharacterized protein